MPRLRLRSAGRAAARCDGLSAGMADPPAADVQIRADLRRVELRILGYMLGFGLSGSAVFGWLIAAPGSHPMVSAFQGMVNAVLVTVPIFLLEVRGRRDKRVRRLRRLPFSAYLLAKSTIYLTVIVISIQVTRLLFLPFAPQSLGLGGVFPLIVAFAAGMSLLANAILEFAFLLGPRVLKSLLTGRYNRPRREERVFAMLDMKDSTAIAERIGDVRFHELLNAFFRDLADAALDCGAEIHKYVGDEAILTWPMDEANRDTRCLSVAHALAARLSANAAFYKERFGTVPEFWTGLHAGWVVAGEVGDFRREIAFVGDTLNVTARLRAACRELGRDALVSRVVLERLPLPPDALVEDLPALDMRGRKERVPVASLTFG